MAVVLFVRELRYNSIRMMSKTRYRIIICLLLLLPSCRAFSPLSVTATAPDLSPVPAKLPANGYTVHIHPEDGLYVGDLVSFEVVATELGEQRDFGEDENTGVYAEIDLRLPTPVTFGPEYFQAHGIGERQQATFKWVWDTTDLEPGEYELTFRILPEGPEWNQTITLFPQDALPPDALEAEWVTTSSDCCLITYLTGTAAGRDIEDIIKQVDDKTSESLGQMRSTKSPDIHVILMPRVLGHGGFASSEIYLSYLDRNYAGEDFGQVLHHELIHVIDTGSNGETPPRILVEGLAVYHTQGHYKQDPLLPCAATLLDLGWYIPLLELSEDFYFHQHEISYMEAGALIEFMVSRWGYEAFELFYRDIYHLTPDRDEASAIDAALQRHFGITFAELEEQFLLELRSYPLEPELRDDVLLTVQLFDTIRRYQQMLDPSAYFLTAWLVTLSDFQSRDIAADYLRHPSQPENLTIENLLISAQESLVEGRFDVVRDILEAVNAVLDGLEKGQVDPFATHSLSESYYRVVTLLFEAGYQPQEIRLNTNSAHVMATQTGPNLIPILINFNQDALRRE